MGLGLLLLRRVVDMQVLLLGALRMGLWCRRLGGTCRVLVLVRRRGQVCRWRAS
jgi:hypothetical protein